MSPVPAPHRNMTALEWTMLLTVATVWGGSFFFNGIAVRELPVFTVAVGRVACALLRLRGHRWPFPA